MAKGIAYCTCATCGEGFTRIKRGLYNSRRAREWEEWAAKNIVECDDCCAARLQKEREANADAAKAAGLPELTGSDKQVAWATTIRHNCLSNLEWSINEEEKRMEKKRAAGKNTAKQMERVALYHSFQRFLNSQAAAHWWIDNRKYMRWECPVRDTRRDWIDDLIECLENEFTVWGDSHGIAGVEMESMEDKETREAAEAEMTVAPEDQIHSGAVDITVTAAEVTAQYERDDDFRALVKGLGYLWDAGRRVWYKSIDFITGPAKERAAELGNNLLNGGFAVRIADPNTRAAAINGDYQPEHRRWITIYTFGDYRGWLCIRLPRGEDMYGAAKALPKARYCKPDVAVPVSEYAAIEDFAEMYDYRISPSARKAMDEAKAAVIVVTPAAAKTAVYRKRTAEDLRPDSAAVLADLTDDD